MGHHSFHCRALVVCSLDTAIDAPGLSAAYLTCRTQTHSLTHSGSKKQLMFGYSLLFFPNRPIVESSLPVHVCNVVPLIYNFPIIKPVDEVSRGKRKMRVVI